MVFLFCPNFFCYGKYLVRRLRLKQPILKRRRPLHTFHVKGAHLAHKYGCKALVVKDVAAKLNEYFELKNLPEMEVVYENGIYRVELKFDALRVKKFNVLR